MDKPSNPSLGYSKDIYWPKCYFITFLELYDSEIAI